MRTLVRGVCAERLQSRGIKGRAGSGGRSLDRAPLGIEDIACPGQGVAPSQAASRSELAHGRDVYSRWQAVKNLYRAVDRLDHTVDFLLTAKRDHAAARSFFERAIGLHDVPEKITIDKSGANTAAGHSMVADSGVEIELRQSEIPEQPHRARPPRHQATNSAHARI